MSMHGSLQSVDIEGVAFQSPADVDVDIVLNEWDNNAVPNGSGAASTSSVRKVPGASNIMVRANATELGLLRGWSDSAEYLEFFMTLRDDSVFGCLGLLKLDSVSTANGTATLSVQCQTTWDISAA